nr:MAG TPA: Structural protein [Caudoviricetes sp.]
MQNQNNLVSVDSSSDFIEHFGIKGMKWGFRKQRISKVKARRRAKNSAKTSAKWKKKYQNRASMSDKDIRKATERLRLENDFAEQIKRNAQVTMKPANKDSFFRDIAKTVVGSATQSTVKKSIDYGFNSVTGGNKKN